MNLAKHIEGEKDNKETSHFFNCLYAKQYLVSRNALNLKTDLAEVVWDGKGTEMSFNSCPQIYQ